MVVVCTVQTKYNSLYCLRIQRSKQSATSTTSALIVYKSAYADTSRTQTRQQLTDSAAVFGCDVNHVHVKGNASFGLIWQIRAAESKEPYGTINDSHYFSSLVLFAMMALSSRSTYANTRSSLTDGVRLTMTLANTMSASRSSAQLAAIKSMTSSYKSDANHPAASASSCVKTSESDGMRYWNITTSLVVM